MSRTSGLPPRPPLAADTWRPVERDISSRFPDSRYSEPSAYGRHDDMYQFRGNGYSGHDENRRPSNPVNPPRRYDAPPPPGTSDSYRPESRGFNFRAQPPPSIDLNRMADVYRPSPPPHNHRSENENSNRNDNHAGSRSVIREPRGSQPQIRGERHYQRQRGGARGPFGPRKVFEKTAERAILLSTRQPTPELMAGMAEEDGNTTKYLPVEDLSDSDEADMDVSDSDAENVGDEAGQPKKKQARTELKQSSDGDSVPRWSNPDPYSVLPPIDENQRKTKDVVKLIRKARVAVASDETPKTQAITDDFISFDFGDSNEENEVQFPGEPHSSNLGVAGAPTGPRAFSHRDSFQQTLPPSDTRAKSGNMNVLDTSSDPSLGNRKRNIDDEITGPPRPVKKAGGKGRPPASGRIMAEWTCPPGLDATPWCSTDHSQTEKMGQWLHKEIVDFYSAYKPRAFEEDIRFNLVDRLRTAVRRKWPEISIYTFGSFKAGLYLPTADMDLVFASVRYMEENGYPIDRVGSKSTLFNVARFLKEEGFAAEGSVETIIGAKVPIVKYVDNRTGLQVDISFENDTGVVANRTFKEWKTQYPAMPILVTLVKQFLAMRGLNEPVNGGIGGFAVTCLVTSLLQLMPQVQSGDMIPEHHLGEILMEFFDLYGNEFNSETLAIDLNPPRWLAKESNSNRLLYRQKQQDKFSIVDPNNPANDITGGSSNTPTIRRAFSDAFRALQKRMGELSTKPIAERKGQSILAVIIGGDYSQFDIQRDHLWKCYQSQVKS